VCVYHGTPDERAELRRTVLIPDPELVDDVWAPGCAPASTKSSSISSSSVKKTRGQPAHANAPKGKNGVPARGRGRGRGRGGAKGGKRKYDAKGSEDDEGEEEQEDKPHPPNTFPVVLTTYEMVIRDRNYLSAYSWGYIVVDEGHRLKNFDSRLMREIKQYPSAGRMILTGTPLQNNLAELWSLLNFILPDIFTDLDIFQEWFNLSPAETGLSTSRTTRIVSSLHAILKPFLLRRMKVDVETDLPPKKVCMLWVALLM
jgi:ATP-dependent DNA helicase